MERQPFSAKTDTNLAYEPIRDGANKISKEPLYYLLWYLKE